MSVSEAGNIIEVCVEEEMQKSYLEYAMSVIVGRALPDVRDGLKPVQRRILYAMHELGLRHRSPYKKSARIVGEVLGKYHPHGDTAVYDAMVRLAQDFTMRYTLVDGQGNFGSIDGDEPAAMRYTEARLSEVAEEMLADIDRETVNWRPNFDSTLKEPEVLPAKFPNLLVNGSSGIAVGMATNIPPHNLSEMVDCIIKVIDEPDVSIEELMEIVKGPDFPTGGIIIGLEGIKNAYKTGRGTVRIRARADIERDRRGSRIVIREIPYQVNKSKLLEEIAAFLKKNTESVVSLRDESDRRGMRIILELRSGANAEILLNRLYKHTSLETSFGIINLALVNGEPRILSLKDMVKCYINHRREVLTRKFRHELRQLEHKKHVLEGILIAISHIEEIISLVKASENSASAINTLKKLYSLSDEQASHILDMKISRLSAIEREKVERQISEISERMESLRSLLSDERAVLKVIKSELQELKRKYGDARRTGIMAEEKQLSVRDLVEEMHIMLVISESGVSRAPISLKRQSRGGKGVRLKGNDVIKIVHATTRQKILLFTSQGRAFQTLAYEIPERGGRYSSSVKLKNIPGLAGMSEYEKISAVLPLSEDIEREMDSYSVVIVTKKGIIKRTPLSLFGSLRSSGVIAVKIAENDALADVTLVHNGTADKWNSSLITQPDERIIIGTRKGKLIMFPVDELRDMGKYAAGVIGIRLEDDDEVVSVESVRKSTARRSHSRKRRHEETHILTITERGYGKKTPVSAYRETHRGGKGIINFKITQKTGDIVAVRAITGNPDILMATFAGMIIRISSKNVPVQGRNAQGARLMNVDEADRVVSVDIV